MTVKRVTKKEVLPLTGLLPIKAIPQSEIRLYLELYTSQKGGGGYPKGWLMQ
jgi:hypothetical protein